MSSGPRPAIGHSLVIPVYRNEGNLAALLAALDRLHHSFPDLEVVFVVDGSPDRSHAVLEDCLPRAAFASQLVAHSRNFGSFAALRTGLARARGELVAVMAADLQEPIELIEQFWRILGRGEADVVFGRRTGRRDPAVSSVPAGVFWAFYRRFVVPDLPPGGVDVFGCSRQVLESLLRVEEANSSLVAQLFWVGYRRAFVDYERRQREAGRSAWSFSRRMRYALDSVFSYSDLPILFVLALGVLGVTSCLVLGVVVVAAKLAGWIEVPGYTAIMVVMLLLFSLTLLTQGVLGCYLWIAMENTKRRPLSIVASAAAWDGTTGPSAPDGAEEVAP